MVRSAILQGTLVRPDKCSSCGKAALFAKDGRPLIQAHHPDYDRPLYVVWLCTKCHRKETPLPAVMGAPVFGSRNGQAKLTEELVRYIRESPEAGNALSKRLGVSRWTVNRARRGTQWSRAAAPDLQPVKEGK